MSGIVVECNSCLNDRLCPPPIRSERHRLASMAFAHDRDLEDCPHYLPSWERGVEGVIHTERRLCR